MSAFTTQLGEVLYSKINQTDKWFPYPTNEIITSVRPHLFDFSYPTFDNGQKASFESTFLKRFWFNEIGEETFFLFKMRLDSRLNEIMPNYIEQYRMYDWIKNNNINWFDDINLTEVKDQQIVDTVRRIMKETDSGTTDSKKNSTRTDNTTQTSENNRATDMTRSDDFVRWNKFSDTPQGALTGIEQDKWLTTATLDTEKGDSENKGTVKDTGNIRNTGTVANNDISNILTSKEKHNTDTSDNTHDLDYTLRLTGKRGSKSYIELLKDFRSLNANINKAINDECADLFMLLWQ